MNEVPNQFFKLNVLNTLCFKQKLFLGLLLFNIVAWTDLFKSNFDSFSHQSYLVHLEDKFLCDSDGEWTSGASGSGLEDGFGLFIGTQSILNQSTNLKNNHLANLQENSLNLDIEANQNIFHSFDLYSLNIVWSYNSPRAPPLS